MKLETLTNIVNNLWHDENVNGIVVRLKWEDIACNMVIDCRVLAFDDEDDVEFAINHVITDILIKIKKAAEERFGDQKYLIGPGIKYVQITKSYLDASIMEVRATLEGRLGCG